MECQALGIKVLPSKVLVSLAFVSLSDAWRFLLMKKEDKGGEEKAMIRIH